MTGGGIISRLIQQQLWTCVSGVSFHLEDSCTWNQAASRSVSQSVSVLDRSVKATVRLVSDKASFVFAPPGLFLFSGLVPALCSRGGKAGYFCSLIHSFGSVTSSRCSQLTLQIRPALCQVVRRNQPEPSSPVVSISAVAES